MRFIDFDNCERVVLRGYRGNAGRKQAYIYDGGLWMVKFPQSTRYMRGGNLPSYTSSPLSEYIGSHIYEALGIPVHETVLGCCQGKTVVGCKDFAVGSELIEFGQIKNTMDEDSISGHYGSSEHGERLSDVLRVIDEAEAFEGLRGEMRGRFWDMIVTDAFILNNDRNNGNWGLLSNRYSAVPAPVYDNGNAFFNKRGLSVMERRMQDDALIEEDVRGSLSFFLDDDDHHIHPFDLIVSGTYADCTAAVERFGSHLDMARILEIIDGIPETHGDFAVISSEMKSFYKRLLLKTSAMILTGA